MKDWTALLEQASFQELLKLKAQLRQATIKRMERDTKACTFKVGDRVTFKSDDPGVGFGPGLWELPDVIHAQVERIGTRWVYLRELTRGRRWGTYWQVNAMSLVKASKRKR
jgi:hypothetical protein